MKTLRIAAAFAAALIAAAASAAPQKRPAQAPRRAAVPVQTAHRRSPYVGALCADAKSGRVLFSDNADAEAYPASVTKLMTLFLVLEDVKAGRYTFDSKAVATADAYRCEPSWIGIKAGESMSVRDLCLALMVESANDAAIVLAVNSSGSFDAFIERMNSRAAALGMTKTRYYNPNGLPPNASKKYPWKSFNTTTASDQLKLALALRFEKRLCPLDELVRRHGDTIRASALELVLDAARFVVGLVSPKIVCLQKTIVDDKVVEWQQHEFDTRRGWPYFVFELESHATHREHTRLTHE